MSTESQEPNGSVNTRLFSIVYIGMFAALIIAGSYLAFPFGASPVPVTLQTLFVGLAGILLGPVRGLLAVLLFLLLGLVGLPVFSEGAGGVLAFAGPTGGFLLGFAPGALLSGLVHRGFLKTFNIAATELPTRKQGLQIGLAAAVAMLAGFLVIYLIGLPWLHMVLERGAPRTFESTLGLGLIPFIPGDLLKVVAAAVLVPFASRLIKE